MTQNHYAISTYVMKEINLNIFKFEINLPYSEPKRLGGMHTFFRLFSTELFTPIFRPVVLLN